MRLSPTAPNYTNRANRSSYPLLILRWFFLSYGMGLGRVMNVTAMHCKAIVWFGFTAVHSVDQSTRPTTKKFREWRQRAYTIDSKIASAPVHCVKQNVTFLFRESAEIRLPNRILEIVIRRNFVVGCMYWQIKCSGRKLNYMIALERSNCTCIFIVDPSASSSRNRTWLANSFPISLRQGIEVTARSLLFPSAVARINSNLPSDFVARRGAFSANVKRTAARQPIEMPRSFVPAPHSSDFVLFSPGRRKGATCLSSKKKMSWTFYLTTEWVF